MKKSVLSQINYKHEYVNCTKSQLVHQLTFEFSSFFFLEHDTLIMVYFANDKTIFHQSIQCYSVLLFNLYSNQEIYITKKNSYVNLHSAFSNYYLFPRPFFYIENLHIYRRFRDSLFRKNLAHFCIEFFSKSFMTYVVI